ncbi:MAG: hypothetical protein GY737_19490 [Desulfobacteraceae bacterium]|nr:hypothetical protein [Desulfobacteraceae bacterium]
MRHGFLLLVMVSVMLLCGAGTQEKNTEIKKHREDLMETAKRRVKRVKPVSKHGIRYEEIRGARARGFPQNGGIIAAIDESTEKELWSLVVYETVYDEREELDVQDVYIKKLKVNWRGTVLTVVNERNKTYEINLKDQSVIEK